MVKGTRIRWVNVARLAAGAIGCTALILGLPALLERPEPPPLPSDVGLSPAAMPPSGQLRDFRHRPNRDEHARAPRQRDADRRARERDHRDLRRRKAEPDHVPTPPSEPQAAPVAAPAPPPSPPPAAVAPAPAPTPAYVPPAPTAEPAPPPPEPQPTTPSAPSEPSEFGFEH
jgi:hypothetical protein